MRPGSPLVVDELSGRLVPNELWALWIARQSGTDRLVPRRRPWPCSMHMSGVTCAVNGGGYRTWFRACCWGCAASQPTCPQHAQLHEIV